MSGFNMPPGVSPSEIPGNRPEDEAFERLINAARGVLGCYWLGVPVTEGMAELSAALDHYEDAPAAECAYCGKSGTPVDRAQRGPICAECVEGSPVLDEE